MAGPLRLNQSIVIPDDELTWRFSRSGGPGGQGVNTTDSRVKLSYDVLRSRALTTTARERIADRLGSRLHDGVLTIVASEHRSQLRNREAAISRLADLLETALRPPPPRRRPSTPSRAARARRVEQKKQRGKTKRLRGRPDDNA